jgi:hypothetical protein
MLLKLPSNLRLEIRKLALTPAPRGLTDRSNFNNKSGKRIKSGLVSFYLDGVLEKPAYKRTQEALQDPLKLFKDTVLGQISM